MRNVTPLVTCDRAREHLLAAPTDDALPVGIAQHLRNCSHCREFAAAVCRLDVDLRNVLASEMAPSELWPRILRALDDGDAPAAAVSVRRAAASDWVMTRLPRRLRFNRLDLFWRPVVGGLAVLLMIVVATLVVDPFAVRRGGVPLVSEPVDDLITYRLTQRSLDLESSNPQVIAEWLNGKIDFRQPKPIAEIGGYRLVGARLCHFLNRRLSALMYLRGEHAISLYSMSNERLDPPGRADAQIAGWKISVHEYKGYTSLVWHEGSLAFVLVSDLSRQELLRVAADLRRRWEHVRDARSHLLGTRLVASASENSGRVDFAHNTRSVGQDNSRFNITGSTK